jgi:hypothetical protein
MAESAHGPLADRLAGVPVRDWHAVALHLVRSETAALIGCAPEDVDPDRSYR